MAFSFSETQYNPLSIPAKTVSSTVEELAIIPDLSDVTFQLVTVGLKTICKIQPDTPSLVMVNICSMHIILFFYFEKKIGFFSLHLRFQNSENQLVNRCIFFKVKI